MLSRWMIGTSKIWAAAALVGVMGSSVLLHTVQPALGQSQVAQSPVSAIEPTTFEGRLDSSSLVLEQDGSYYNLHTFEGVAGQTIQVDLTSDAFNTYLLLLDPEGNLLDQNDDGGENTNARLVLTLPSSGTYTIVANSHTSGETGQYTLTIQSASEQAVATTTQLAEADALNQQVIQLYQEGRYGEAIPLAERVLEIRETALGDNHPDVATSLNNLASLYYAQGNYGAAEPLYQRSLQIRETALGANHPAVAASLNNLAVLYREQGNYGAAEPLYQRSLQIRESTLGENHPAVAQSLNNLASLYYAQGNYGAAEPLYQRSLQIREMALGENHPDVATSLNNLASLYRAQGNYAEAEPLFQRSLQILETALGANHPLVAGSLNNLANLLYRDQGNYGAAELLYQRSLQIREISLGESHPDVATSLNNLATLYREQGNYGAAEPLFQRSLQIAETALGENHPNVAISLNSLALLYQAQGNIPQALAFRQRGLDVQETNLALNLSIGSEERKQAYLATLFGTTNRTISLHLQSAPDNTDAAQLALTTVLRRKGRILDAVTASFQRLRDNLTPELASLLDEYTTTQSQLSNLVYRGLGDQDPDVYRNQLNTLQQQAEDLENQLAQRSAEFRIETQPVEIEDIQALIPSDAVLVELVRYYPFDPSGAGSWGEPRYAAYVLHANGEIQWADLGDAATIDQAAFEFLSTTQSPASGNRVRTTGRELDELVMELIRPLLGDATHILLSPDSQLNLIPFAALVDEQDRYLVETYTLTHLTTGRDLLRLQNPSPSQQPPVIFANPDYDLANPTQVAALVTTRSASTTDSERSVDIATLQFGPLPGTQLEVDAIAPLLDDPVILTEAEATENVLQQLQSPAILHIATHGFFLQDVEFAPPETRSGTGTIFLEFTGDPAIPSNNPTSNENPLLRSGLAFAGFNQRESQGEDGVLTALEAANLDLRGTNLVVMSACETGIGDVANGEGVYGLRRAFVMAGAESQLMSLWKVSDQGTAELMQLYYDRLLSGQERSESLRQVQLELLAAPAYSHPYYWSGFIFSGDWTAIAE